LDFDEFSTNGLISHTDIEFVGRRLEADRGIVLYMYKLGCKTDVSASRKNLAPQTPENPCSTGEVCLRYL
jgi:hypothetical protein